jgi:D-alanine-D-alanine ligase-like ATP-grasp enzyme
VKTLAIITGGKSPEHDVAIISSRNIFKAVDTTQYEIKVVGISKSGQWYLLPDQTLFEEGIKIGCIAKKYEMSRATLSKLIKKHNLKQS